MITYAQNFEDVMLERLFREQATGYYVDIGAWHPVLNSVTQHFYSRGWRGINVEPVKGQFDLFERDRKRDLNLNLAIADRAGEIIFYECLDTPALSTGNRQQAERLRSEGWRIVEYKVKTITLKDLAGLCDAPVDFLKVDAEGMESRIFEGADWKIFRPRVLVIEVTEANSLLGPDQARDRSLLPPWEKQILASGYSDIHFDGLSSFYLRSEDSRLGNRLLVPPCVHDNILKPAESAEINQLRVGIASLEAQLKAVEGDRDAKAVVVNTLVVDAQKVEVDRSLLRESNRRLAADLSAIEGDRAAKAEVVERLLSEARAMEADRSLLRESNRRLAADLSAVKADRAAKGEVVERLLSEAKVLEADRSLLRESNDRRETDLLVVEADRAAKGQAVERLLEESTVLRTTIGSLEHRISDRESELRQSTETARLLKMLALQRRENIVAKDQVVRHFAQNEVKRRAFGAGIPDVLFRRGHRPLPVYGNLISAIEVGGGLHVGIDTLEIRFGVSGGVETYMRMLVEALLLGGYRVTMLCLSDQIEPLRRIFGGRVSYFVARATRAAHASVWLGNKLLKNSACLTAGATLMTFSRLAEDLNIDVLHSPVQVFSTPDFSVPAVLNLHDLQHIHFPENFRPSDIEARNHLYRQSANLADAIMVSSEFVRNDLITHLNVAPAKVITVPVTWSPLVEAGLRDFDAAAARIQYGLPKSYGLFPAQFWPHKNHVRLLDALRIVRDRLPEEDFKLVFTGYRGHSGWAGVSDTIARLGLEADVMCLDYVPAGHLAGLYKASLFCVMPSLFEASSYPVIEAQMLEVPAMCSHVTSLPELMRDGAGLLFDPLDPEDMAAQMMRWIGDPADRLEHARRGHERVRRENSLACYIKGIARTYDFVLGRSRQV